MYSATDTVAMAEGTNEATEHDRFMDLAVMKIGNSPVEYTIPSFPVISVRLWEVRLQWEGNGDDTDRQCFDGFIRDCDLLQSARLPAIARIPFGHEHACFVEVRVGRTKLQSTTCTSMCVCYWCELSCT